MFQDGMCEVSAVLRTSRSVFGLPVIGQPVWSQITRGIARFRAWNWGFNEIGGTFTVFAKLVRAGAHGQRKALNR